jgi:hypothetical protein
MFVYLIVFSVFRFFVFFFRENVAPLALDEERSVDSLGYPSRFCCSNALEAVATEKRGPASCTPSGSMMGGEYKN